MIDILQMGGMGRRGDTKFKMCYVQVTTFHKKCNYNVQEMFTNNK